MQTSATIERNDGAVLEGRLSWRTFLGRHLAAIGLLGGSLLTPFVLIRAGGGKTLIADCFAALVGTSSLLHLGIWLATVVTRFRMVDGALTFARLGRRPRTVGLDEVSAVDDATSTASAATIWLRDGSTLVLPLADLANSGRLVDAIRAARPRPGTIEGCLNRVGVATSLVQQWLASCLLLAISLVGALLLALGVRGSPLIADPTVFLLPAIALLALCALGFSFGIVRPWIGCVHSFRWDGAELRYRTVFTRALDQRHAGEVEEVSAGQVGSTRREAGTWQTIRFRGGARIKLHVGMLQNADALFDALKAEVVRRAGEAASAPGMTPPVTAQHPLWTAIRPRLEPDEEVLWLGQPDAGKLRGEMAAEMIFGLIPSAIGVALLAIGWHLDRKGDRFAWFGAAIGALFGTVGLHLLSAPWRYRRMLGRTVYAVSTRRVLILHGVRWGSQSTVQPGGIECESFDRRRVHRCEVVGRRRDILLGGEWKRGSKGRRYWLHAGFLAPDDPLGAVRAIHRLLAEAPITP